MAYFPSVNNCKQLTINADTQLDYPYSVTPGNVEVTDIIDITVTAQNIKVFLPDASETTPGFAITFNNVGTNAFDIVLHDKVTVLNTVGVGEFKTFYVYDVSTSNGNWRIINAGDGQSGITNLVVKSTNSSVNINGSPVTNPGGEVDLTLDNLIAKLKTLSNIEPGVLLFDRNKTDIWSSGSIVGDNNITVENYDGSAGSLITVKLDTNITLTQVISGNIKINGNTITNTNVNNDLSFTSNGVTSKANINGVLIDKNRNLTNINDIIALGSFISPNIAKSWCRFNNTSGSISVTAKFNVDTVVYNSSNNQYTINFIKPMGTTEYGVQINCSNNNSDAPLTPRIGQDIIRTTTSVTIVLINSSGEMLSDFPEGVTVVIYSLT
jgi:hypothetical protein